MLTVRLIVIVANCTISVNCYTDVTPCKQPSSKLGRVVGAWVEGEGVSVGVDKGWGVGGDRGVDGG